MTGWRRWLRPVVFVALTLLLYFAVPVSGAVRGDELSRLVLCALALMLITVTVVWQVRLQLEDEQRRIDGLVVALVVAVLGFALGFYVMELRDPGQIPGLDTRLDGLYFAMSTLLTIGYGDIHAVGQAARVLVLVQMVFNVVVITTAVTTISNHLRERAKVAIEDRRAAAAQDPPPRRRRRDPDRRGRRPQAR